MAKKQKVNKSQAVREYLKAHHQATNSEIAEALTKKGIKITPAYVATIKTKAKAKRECQKGERKACWPAVPPPQQPPPRLRQCLPTRSRFNRSRLLVRWSSRLAVSVVSENCLT